MLTSMQALQSYNVTTVTKADKITSMYRKNNHYANNKLTHSLLCTNIIIAASFESKLLGNN